MRNNAFFLNYAQKHYVREYGFHMQVRTQNLLELLKLNRIT